MSRAILGLVRYAGVAVALGVLVGCSIDSEGLAPTGPRLDAATGVDAATGADADGPTEAGCVPDSPPVELCDGADNDCDPSTPDGANDPGVGAPCDGSDDDACEEGTTICVGRTVVCEDLTGNAHETCNDSDDDCDGFVDEAALDAAIYYADGDGDGFGLDAMQVVACAPPPDHATQPGDCDDASAAVSPGQPEACNLIDDDCSGAIDDTSACPCTGHRFSDRVYLFCPDEISWWSARDDCVDQGGHLVRVDDMAEHAFLTERTAHYRPGRPWWIGLTDSAREMEWRWTDGSTPAFTKWSPGEPNDGDSFIVAENCAEMGPSATGDWNDQECGDDRPYVCEIP